MKKEPITLKPSGSIYRIDGGSYMKSCFEITFLENVREISFSSKTFASVAIINGRGYIVKDGNENPIKRGETFIIPASFGDYLYVGEEPLDILISLPPS
jgi:mannose-6-phosphate isomerase class I